MGGDAAGLTGAYTFSAATLNIPATPGTSRVVSLPYDFMFVYTDVSGKADAPLADRLLAIEAELAAVVERYQPEAMAVEDLFNAKNARSSLILGHARGVILLIGARAGLTVEVPEQTARARPDRDRKGAGDR